MPIKVKLPTQLRSLSEGAAEVPAAGGTVGEVIADLETRHPGISARLLDDQGKLRRFVNVYVNDEDVRFLDGLETPLSSDAQLSIIPAVAGGAQPSS
jgi:sulfur-carrier protein